MKDLCLILPFSCSNDLKIQILCSTSGKSMRTMRTLPCRLIVMRHAERVDDLFPGWIEKSTSTGIYQAYDLNMVTDNDCFSFFFCMMWLKLTILLSSELLGWNLNMQQSTSFQCSIMMGGSSRPCLSWTNLYDWNRLVEWQGNVSRKLNRHCCLAFSRLTRNS